MNKLADALQDLGASIPEARGVILPVLKEASYDPDRFIEELADDLNAKGLDVTLYSRGTGSTSFDLEFAGSRPMPEIVKAVKEALERSRSASRVRQNITPDEAVVECEYGGMPIEILLYGDSGIVTVQPEGRVGSNKEALNALMPDKAGDKTKDLLTRNGFQYVDKKNIRAGLAYRFKAPSGSEVQVDLFIGRQGILFVTFHLDGREVKQFEVRSPMELEEACEFIAKKS